MRLLPPDLNFNQLRRLAAQANAGSPGARTVRIAVLGDSATQFLVQALQSTGILAGIHFETFESDFNQIDRQVYDPGSDLYASNPDYIVLAWTARKCRNAFYKLSSAEQSVWHETFGGHVRDICQVLRERTKAKLLLFNLEHLDDGVFGHFAAKTAQSFPYQIRLFNVASMRICTELPGIYPIDVAALQARTGVGAHQPNIYVNTELVHSLDFTAQLAQAITGVVGALEGRFHKCLILDLDNTLWGGVIGDDGVEHIELGGAGVGKAFMEFQAWIKQLQLRGIILAVCSKNNEEVAKQPFISHPDMQLRLDDIAVFVANWENKADNIRHIQQILNIGFDSMVFFDDNPVERQLVKEQLPEVAVPDLPEDPAFYLEALQGLGLFETASVSETDAQRTQQYQQEAERVKLSQRFTNVDEFLRSLNMTAYTRPFQAFDIPRVAQLSQRSNQFNLRTVRYSEADIAQLVASPKHHTLAFDLNDKFGPHGLIAVVVLEEKEDNSLFIDTWFMSCRVLKRGMEDYMLGQLVELARTLGKDKLRGEYLPTAKNAMVKDHYKGLGFEPDGEQWALDTRNFEFPEYFIEKTTQEK